MEGSKKQIGLMTLTALVSGNMIGSGVFLLPANLAQLGSLSLVSWLVTTLGTMFIALVFCHISTVVTKTGGPYAYAREGMGKVVGFQMAFCYWIAIWVGNAAIALTGVSYLAVFFPSLGGQFVSCFVTICSVWIFTLINLRGMKSFGFTQNLLTVLKLLPIALVIFLGWSYFNPQYLLDSVNVSTPHVSGSSVITQGMALTLWAFIGVESATIPSESVENPRRNIPLATLLGTGIAAVAYILSSTVIMGMIPNAALQVSTAPFADAAALIFGDWGKWIAAAGAAISCFGCLNGWILLQGLIPMAAAEDRLFLRIFAQKNKHDVPHYGVIISSVLISILLLLTISPNLNEQFKLIILIATFANVIPYLYTPIAEVIIEKFRLSGKNWFFAILAMVYSFWAIIGTGAEVLQFGALLLLISIPCYLFVARYESQY